MPVVWTGLPIAASIACFLAVTRQLLPPSPSALTVQCMCGCCQWCHCWWPAPVLGLSLRLSRHACLSCCWWIAPSVCWFVCMCAASTKRETSHGPHVWLGRACRCCVGACPGFVYGVCLLIRMPAGRHHPSLPAAVECRHYPPYCVQSCSHPPAAASFVGLACCSLLRRQRPSASGATWWPAWWWSCQSARWPQQRPALQSGVLMPPMVVAGSTRWPAKLQRGVCAKTGSVVCVCVGWILALSPRNTRGNVTLNATWLQTQVLCNVTGTASYVRHVLVAQVTRLP